MGYILVHCNNASFRDFIKSGLQSSINDIVFNTSFKSDKPVERIVGLFFSTIFLINGKAVDHLNQFYEHQ